MESIQIQQDFLRDTPYHKLIVEEVKQILRDEKIQHHVLTQNQATQTTSFENHSLSHKTLDTIWVTFLLESLQYSQQRFNAQTLPQPLDPDYSQLASILPSSLLSQSQHNSIPQFPNPARHHTHDFNTNLTFLSHFNPNVDLLDIYRDGNINNIYIPSYREYLSMQHRGRTPVYSCLISPTVFSRVQALFPSLLSTELYTCIPQGSDNAMELHTIMNVLTQVHYFNDFFHFILRFCDHRQRLSILEIPNIIYSMVYEFTHLRSTDDEGLAWLLAQDKGLLQAYYLACSVRLYPQLTQHLQENQNSLQQHQWNGIGNDITSLGFDDLLLDKLHSDLGQSIKTRQNLYLSLAKGQFDDSVKELVGAKPTFYAYEPKPHKKELEQKLKKTISSLSSPEQDNHDSPPEKLEDIDITGPDGKKKFRPLDNTTTQFRFFKKTISNEKLLPKVAELPQNSDNIPIISSLKKHDGLLYQNILLLENIESFLDVDPLSMLHNLPLVPTTSTPSLTSVSTSPSYSSNSPASINNSESSPTDFSKILHSLAQSIRTNPHLISFYTNLQYAFEKNPFVSIFHKYYTSSFFLRKNVNLMRAYTLFLMKSYYICKDEKFNPSEKEEMLKYQLFIKSPLTISHHHNNNNDFKLLPISHPYYKLNTADAVGYTFATELKKKQLIQHGPQNELDEIWYNDNITQDNEEMYQSLLTTEHSLDFSSILDPILSKAQDNLNKQRLRVTNSNSTTSTTPTASPQNTFLSTQKPTPSIHINQLLSQLPWQQLASQYNDGTFFAQIYSMLSLNHTITPFTYQYIEYLYQVFYNDPLTKLLKGISIDSLVQWLHRSISTPILSLIFERYGTVIRIPVEIYHKAHTQPPQDIFHTFSSPPSSITPASASNSITPVSASNSAQNNDGNKTFPSPPPLSPTSHYQSASTASTNQNIYTLYQSYKMNNVIPQHNSLPVNIATKITENVNQSGLFYTIPTLSWCHFIRFIFATDYPYEKDSISYWFNILDVEQTGIITSESLMQFCQYAIHHLYPPCDEMKEFYTTHPFSRTIQTDHATKTEAMTQRSTKNNITDCSDGPTFGTSPLAHVINQCEQACNQHIPSQFPSTHEFNSIVLSQYSSFLDPNHSTRLNMIPTEDLKINNKGKDSLRVQKWKADQKVKKHINTNSNIITGTSTPLSIVPLKGSLTPLTTASSTDTRFKTSSIPSFQLNASSTATTYQQHPSHFTDNSLAHILQPNDANSSTASISPQPEQSSQLRPMQVMNTICSNTTTAYHCLQCYTYSTLIMTFHTVALAQLSTVSPSHFSPSHHQDHHSSSHSTQFQHDNNTNNIFSSNTFYTPPLASLFNTNQYDITRYNNVLHYLDSPQRYGLSAPPSSSHSSFSSSSRFNFSLNHFLANQDAVKILYSICFPSSVDLLDDFDESESLPRDTLGYPILTTLRGEILNLAQLQQTEIPISLSSLTMDDNDVFGGSPSIPSHSNSISTSHISSINSNKQNNIPAGQKTALLNQIDGLHDIPSSSLDAVLTQITQSTRSGSVLQRHNGIIQHIFLQQYIISSKQLLDVENTRLIEQENLTRCCTEISPL